MKNQELAHIFYKLAVFLEMEKVAFKPYAHERAALCLEALEEDAEDIYKRGGLKALEQIPGIGRGLALKIEEYLETGKIKEYERLRAKLPIELDELMAVEGVGPQKAKVLYQKLGIKNIKDLEEAAKAHQIAPLFGFGEATERNILQSIAFLKRSKGRFLLAEILPFARAMVKRLKTLKEVKEIELAGSLRRMKETIGDVDILAVATNPEKVMDFFIAWPGTVKVWSRGRTRSSIRVGQGLDVDLRLVPQKSYGSALQYFTGSKEHNIATRLLAIEKGLKLNEYGVFRGQKMIAGKNEKEVYRAIGLPWIEPEIREDKGEIETDLLPRLVELSDIKGDLHCHSDWDGGEDSILDMAQAAIDRGYRYIGISDHTKFLRIEEGLDERRLAEQRREIDKINEKFKVQGSKFKVLQGAETNILNDGSLDIKDETLEKLDYVIAGIHSSFKMTRGGMTERIIRAMKNPYVKIISHPTGRVLKQRDEYQIDLDKVLRTAKETRTVLEINASPARLDLNDQNVRRAKKAGVKMIIDTDTHQKAQLQFMEFGLAQARRGWAEKDDIVNTRPLQNLIKLFHS